MRGLDRLFKGLMMLILVLVLSLLVSLLVEHLWNWLMPGIFGLRTITYWQSVGLLLLSKILLGGFHPRGRGGRRGGWKQRMEKRWAGMSAEEREALRAGMRGRHGCGWSREDKEQFRAQLGARWGRGPRGPETSDAGTKEAV